jgi:hypothetical protein
MRGDPLPLPCAVRGAAARRQLRGAAACRRAARRCAGSCPAAGWAAARPRAAAPQSSPAKRRLPLPPSPRQASDGGSDGETCWICLDDAAQDGTTRLVRPCRCPRKVHPQCLARWQLQQAGKHEEKFCRCAGARARGAGGRAPGPPPGVACAAAARTAWVRRRPAAAARSAPGPPSPPRGPAADQTRIPATPSAPQVLQQQPRRLEGQPHARVPRARGAQGAAGDGGLL